MYCPMCMTAGHLFECKKANCAWWNEYREECIIKTFVRSAEHKIVTIEKEWGKDI